MPASLVKLEKLASSGFWFIFARAYFHSIVSQFAKIGEAEAKISYTKRDFGIALALSETAPEAAFLVKLKLF
jgi:hypothetical protein